MKSLTFIIFFVLSLVRFLNYHEQDNSNDIEFTIRGKVVNKLGETSQSTQGVEIDHIRGGLSRGSATTDEESNFLINSIFTGIEGISDIDNYIKPTGANPFNNNTKFKVSVDAPGKIIETDISGRILGMQELDRAGVYEFTYDGHGTADGMRFISVATEDGWKETLKLIQQGGSAGSQGMRNISFEDAYKEMYGLKSGAAETDTLRLLGENITDADIEFTHDKQDTDVGQLVVNQGPELAAAEVNYSTPAGVEKIIYISNYVYDDGQSNYVSSNTAFELEGDLVKFTSEEAGTYSTTITVIDDEDPNLTKDFKINLNVTEGDDLTPPDYIASDTLRGNEDEAIYLNLNESATDNKASPEELNWTIGDGNFTSTSISGRTATFTPNANISGIDRVVANITDPSGNIRTKEIVLAYEEVPDAPVANDDTYQIQFETETNLDVLSNDVDVENNIQADLVSIITAPQKGTATVKADGSIDYTPNAGAEGADFFEYEIIDATGLKDSARADINITTDPNNAPVAFNDAASTAYQTPLNDINVAANDTDIDGNLVSTSVVIQEGPSNGSASVDANGYIDYTPNNGFSGNDVISYTIKDSEGLESNIASLTITVAEKPNEAPVAYDDVASTNYETAKNNINVAANDTDADNNLDLESVVIKTGPNNGNASVDANGYIDYTPNNGFSGNDQITYTIKDTEGLESNQATLTITVGEAPNQAPVANNDAASTNYETAKTINVLANDTDSDGSINASSVSIYQQPNNGSVSVNTITGTITYTPNNGFSGNDNFKYTVKDDDNATSNAATVTITVGEAPNQAPVANNDAATTPYETAKTIDVLANDTDSDGSIDASTVNITQQPSNGSASVDVNGNIIYTPNNGFSGNDLIKYTVKDDDNAVSNIADVVITVGEAPNQAPVANNDAASTNYQTAKTIDVLANDSDSDGSLVPSSVSVTQQPSNGSTSVNSTTGAITYTPNNGFSGNDNFQYTVKDNDNATSNVATVSVSVGENPNVAPVANDDAVSTAYETAKNNINVAANDTDENDNLDLESVVIKTGPNNGNASVDANGYIDYTPNNGFSGNDQITYTIKDTEGLESNIATLTITVETAPNNPPTANNDAATTAYQTNVTIDILANDSDSDGTLDKSTVLITQNPSNGSITGINTTTGAPTYQPNNGFSGNDSFKYKVKDDDGDYSNEATVSVTVEEQQAQMVTQIFKFRAASTDQDLTSGTSTLRYKKLGDANYTTLTSTSGTFSVEMEKNAQYEIDGSHSGDLETAYGVGSIYLAMKRPGDLEAFEQRAVDDASSPMTPTSDNQTVYLYKFMSNFPIGYLQEYASKDQNGQNTGTRKFSVSDKDAPFWWDNNYESYTAEQRQWASEVISNLTSLPHVYLTLPFQEGTSTPSQPHLRVAVDESFPSPGTNGTDYNSNHEITQARARYPLSFSEYTFKIEILQAIGDLNDIGGDPAIVNPQTQGYTLNTTGEKMFSVMYLFQPGTEF